MNFLSESVLMKLFTESVLMSRLTDSLMNLLSEAVLMSSHNIRFNGNKEREENRSLMIRYYFFFQCYGWRDR